MIACAQGQALYSQDIIVPPQKPTFDSRSPHLIPAKKPKPRASQNNFTKRSQNLISADDFNDVIPPRLPRQKQNLNVVSARDDREASGVPIPAPKPKTFYQSAGTEPFRSHSTIEKDVQISFSDYDDRTAGGWRHGSSSGGYTGTPRPPRIKETDEKSPFKTASLPRAGKISSQEPIIIFFEENALDLEVGQMAIIEREILTTLKRNSQKKAMIYGFADKSSGDDRANRLSLNRATLIAQYLSDNGIRDTRIMLRAMGSDTPIFPKDRVDVVIE